MNFEIDMQQGNTRGNLFKGILACKESNWTCIPVIIKVVLLKHKVKNGL